MNDSINEARGIETRRGAMYKILQDNILRYLTSLNQMDEDSEEEAKGLPNFPETPPEDLESLRDYIDTTAKRWVDIYDSVVLKEYDPVKALNAHDPDLCVPCFVRRPDDQPLYIQYLYCARMPDQPHTIPYPELVQGIQGLSEEERKKFDYEVRLAYLESASAGSSYCEKLQQLIDAGPEQFYNFILRYYEEYPDQKPEGVPEEELRAKSERDYDELVALARSNELQEDSEGDDYVYEKNSLSANALGSYYGAYTSLRIMRDLILQKVS